MVHEDLHQRGPVKIRKARYLADHPDVAKPLNGFAILAVLVADQNYPVNWQFSGVQSREGQQCVIDCSCTAASRKYHWQLKLDHHVQHELLLIYRDEHAAQALDDQPIIQQSRWQIDPPEIDFYARPPRGQVRRNWRYKLVDFIQRSVRPDSRKPHHRHSVGAFERPCLDRLPVDGIKRRAQQRRERRLPDAGVRARDKEMISHARPAA